ncbi:MAG: hypothetical protein KA314_23720 [Chloroflexi bacterium]|nr:hypothetical protein [Chloroflexota bacterium]MBP8058854.1 hypothetical protein [Chloroflexota bacterium]
MKPLKRFFLVLIICLGTFVLLSTTLPVQSQNTPVAAAITKTLYLYAVNPLDPGNLAINHDGDIWFASFHVSGIGHLDATATDLTYYTIPGNVWGIHPDTSGFIWYTTGNRDAIGRLDPATNNRWEWAMGDAHHFGLDLSESGDVWFDNGSTVGRLIPTSNNVTLWTVSPSLDVFDVTLDDNGMVWFVSRSGLSPAIVRLNPQNDEVTAWVLPAGEPYRLHVESADSLWFTYYGPVDHRIVQLIPSTNTLNEFVIPTVLSGPSDILRQGNDVWFAETGVDQIGQLSLAAAAPLSSILMPTVFTAAKQLLTISPTTYSTSLQILEAPLVTSTITGTVNTPFTEFAVPIAGGRPFGLEHVGEAIWFSETSANRIGRFVDHTPTLTINHAQGAPGSFFVVQGTAFPPDEALTLTINGYTFTTTVSVDNNGLLTFELDTTQAESGYYTVTASGNKPASVTFVLDLGAPVYPTQGNTLVFVVPGGLALTHQDYLPVVGR